MRRCVIRHAQFILADTKTAGRATACVCKCMRARLNAQTANFNTMKHYFAEYISHVIIFSLLIMSSLAR